MTIRRYLPGIALALVGCYPQFDAPSEWEREPAKPGTARGGAAGSGEGDDGGKSGNSAGGSSGSSAGGSDAPGTGGDGAGVSASGGGGSSSGGGAGGGSAVEPGACSRGTAVLAGHVTNARDLGGLPVAGGNALACGVIYRGGPLKSLTPEGCAQVEQLGLQTVIDLRVAGEAEANPMSACVGAQRAPAPLPIPYELSPEAYLRDLDTADSIAAAFRAFGNPDAYPIYFHCTYGRDRTGVLSALLLLTLGVSPEDVMADYLLSQSSVGAYPNSLQAVLDEIAARGGPEAVLVAAGITPSEIAALRTRALEPAP